MKIARTVPLILLLTVGCSSTAVLRPSADLEQEVERLKVRVLELQRKAAVSEVEIGRLREKVARLEVRPGPRSELDVERRDRPFMPPRLPQTSPPPLAEVEVVDLDEGQRSASDATPAGVGVSPAVQTLYDRGYTLYHQGRYLDAESSLYRFLQSYTGTDLADNAYYWIGECRYARGDLASALSAFRETADRYPHGNKVPDALLKAGQTLESMGDGDGARRSYLELRRRFPDSAAALIAGQRLAAREFK